MVSLEFTKCLAELDPIIFLFYFSHQILRYLYASRGGLSETELLALIPNLTLNFLSVFTEVLTEHLVLKYQGGLLTFAHEQVGYDANKFFLKKLTVNEEI